MSESVTLKSYFYEVLIPSSQKNTSSPIEDILHHVSKYIFYEKACALQMFQSTHPHGVRPATTGLTDYRLNCFNPRTHTGCDGVRQIRHGAQIVGFNPRTHTGCDLGLARSCNLNAGFNPRTHTGCDLKARVTNELIIWFQSTHPHGVRLKYIFSIFSIVIVSIHAPTRGATLGSL